MMSYKLPYARDPAQCHISSKYTTLSH